MVPSRKYHWLVEAGSDRRERFTLQPVKFVQSLKKIIEK